MLKFLLGIILGIIIGIAISWWFLVSSLGKAIWINSESEEP